TRAADEGSAGGEARPVVRARRRRRRGALEAERAGPVDVAAEAAVHSLLGGDRSGERLTRLGPRRGRQGEGDREAADVQVRRRRAVVGAREARVERGVGRSAGRAVVGSAVPLALTDTELMTHRLIGVVAEFGIGSGGPNRHPTLVQLRLLAPGSVDLLLISVSAVPLQSDTVVSELPMSGTWNGSGTPELPPPV